ncbi:MAG TPA: dienelactone hydrolase family protein [Kouleothrix sp.]|nr:dienelactone hydrolase family protein [Kouleothrix sp.]
MLDITTTSGTIRAYLALPAYTPAPGVLVLHAWWGLTPFVHHICDQLAEAGFVALAPDMFQGRTANTVEAAQAMLEEHDDAHVQAAVAGAAEALLAHPAVSGPIAVLGFSFGAAWALLMTSERPEDIHAAVLFYGSYSADFNVSQAAYLGHFAENDPWEPLDGIHQMEADLRTAGRHTRFYIYPGTQHWFVETDRPEYNPEAAALAWERTITFLNEQFK